MNALLFGGNSQRNNAWIHEIAEAITPDFEKITVHEYAHWNGRGETIDFELELSGLHSEVYGSEPYMVFAKSVGSVLVLKAINAGILNPIQCVFAGLPIKLAEEENIPLQALLKSNSAPTIFIQNTNDPVASYSKLVAYLHSAEATHYQTIELEGNTHSYDDMDRLRSILLSCMPDTTKRIQ